MRARWHALPVALVLCLAMREARSVPVAEPAHEGVFPDGFLNIAALAEPRGDVVYALVAPSADASITAPRPLQLAKISMKSGNEIQITVVPLALETDGDSWRRGPLIMMHGNGVIVAYANKEGKTLVTGINPVNGEAKPLPLNAPGAPVALMAEGERAIVATTTGIYLEGEQKALVSASDCSPVRAIATGNSSYALFCGTTGTETHVQRMRLASSTANGEVSVQMTPLGTINGVPSIAESAGAIAPLLVTDPQSRQARLAHITENGDIAYVELDDRLSSSARISIVGTGKSPLTLVTARNEELNLYRKAGNRMAMESQLKFKDPQNRVSHVRGVRAVTFNGKAYVVVETYLVALRGLETPADTRNASRISLIPLD